MRLLTNATATVTDTYDYDAFGNLIYRSGTTPNDYLYTGEQFDANLGFYYLRARYMNPASGRFFSMDSFEGGTSDPRSLHKYLYTGSDPVNHIDPSGNTFIGTVQSLAIHAIVTAYLSLRFLAVLRLASAAITAAGLLLGEETRDTTIVAAGSPYEAMQIVGGGVALVFRNVRGSFTVVPVGEKVLRGSGPVAGVLEVSPQVRSTRLLANYYPPEGGIEFVFDPRSNTFVVGRPAASSGLTGSPHQQLARSIGADESSVVGGMFRRGPTGQVYTDQSSGHYHKNWTEAIRKQFTTYLNEATGLTIIHEP